MKPACLLTGSSGFLGQYLKNALDSSYEVHTVSRNGSSAPYHFIADLSREEIDFGPICFDMVVHAAGLAHTVPKTEDEKKAFSLINISGTLNLLNSLDNCKSDLKSFVFISSVSVYGRDSGENIHEDAPLNAADPYGKSKIEVEVLIGNWCISNNINFIALRLPLIIGKNPKGNFEKMLNGIKSGRYARIGTGSARKSMVLAEDVARLIPTLTDKSGIYNLTDGHHPSFAELENAITDGLKIKPVRILPSFAAKCLGWGGDILESVFGINFPLKSTTLKKITSPLTFNDERARRELLWNPRPVLQHIKQIVSR